MFLFKYMCRDFLSYSCTIKIIEYSYMFTCNVIQLLRKLNIYASLKEI